MFFESLPKSTTRFVLSRKVTPSKSFACQTSVARGSRGSCHWKKQGEHRDKCLAHTKSRGTEVQKKPHRSVDLGISSGSTSMLPSERFLVLNTTKWGNLLFFYQRNAPWNESCLWEQRLAVRSVSISKHTIIYVHMYVILSWPRTLPPQKLLRCKRPLKKKLARKDTALEAARAEHLAMPGIPGFRNCFRKKSF